MNRLKKILLLFSLLLPAWQLQAQYWEVTFKGGASGYIGDINPSNVLQFSGLGIGGEIKYNFNSRIALGLSYSFVSIKGDDSQSFNVFQQARNLNFKSNLSELSLLYHFDFLKYIPSESQNTFTPYLLLGFGVFSFDPRTVYQGREYRLAFIGTEGQTAENLYNTYAFQYLYGVGIKFNIWDRFSLEGSLGYRSTNTDFIDDISGFYPNFDALDSDIARILSDRSVEKNGFSIGVTNTQRGDNRPRDHYFFLTFKISYAIIPKNCEFYDEY